MRTPLRVLSAVLCLGLCVDVSAQRRPAFVGIPFSVRTPELETFELALDELELDWSEAGAAGRPLAAQPVVIDGTALSERTATSAVFRVTAATSPELLASICRGLESANPASECNFVLYAPDTNRDAGTRRVMTTHLAVVLEDPASVAALEAFVQNPEPMDGVPGGFVFEAFDPLAAAQIADAIRVRDGIKSAYPLVKRRQFAR